MKHHVVNIPYENIKFFHILSYTWHLQLDNKVEVMSKTIRIDTSENEQSIRVETCILYVRVNICCVNSTGLKTLWGAL